MNWNGAEMLRKYLPSVVQYCPATISGNTSAAGIETEVVVADNGSTDESLQVLAKEFPTVKTIVLDRNYGFAEGYNRAIDQLLEGERGKVKGERSPEYVVLLNSDVEVTENWLTPLLDYLETHPNTAAVQPKIRSWVHKDRFEHAGAAGGFVNSLGYPYCRGRVLWNVEEDKGQYDTIVNVHWTSGACMCVRTQVYKECGGLEAIYWHACLRAWCTIWEAAA